MRIGKMVSRGLIVFAGVVATKAALNELDKKESKRKTTKKVDSKKEVEITEDDVLAALNVEMACN
jgi:hypothetical protein